MESAEHSITAMRKHPLTQLWLGLAHGQGSKRQKGWLALDPLSLEPHWNKQGAPVKRPFSTPRT